MIAERLRKSILQAAIQGMLTEQLPEDGDARDLLSEIQAEKTQMMKAGKIKKGEALPEISEDEMPFEIPENWCWVRLGNIVSVKGGKRIPVGKKLTATDTGFKYIRVADMHEGTVLNTDVHYVPVDVYPQIKNYTISSDDVYITCAGTIGRGGTIPEEFDGANLTENADKLVFRLLNKNWLSLVLDSPFVQMQISECTTQVGQPKLAIKRIETFVIALPPTAEQTRIVESINEVLLKIKELEKDETKLDTLQKAFPKKIKDSLLQSAIQGKLTEQLESDGDAHDLVAEIQKEKARLIKEKKIKKEKELPEITAEEIPFDIPENWCWVRLGNVLLVNPRNHLEEDKEVSFVPMTSINEGYISRFESENRKWKSVKSGFTHFAENDVVLAKITPCFQNLKSAVMSNLTNGFGAGTTELHVFRRYSDQIDCKYLLYFMKNSLFIKEGVATMKGTAGQQRVSTDFVKEYIFPLPPLAEQHRIVERLDQLLPLCEALE
jgi:type I restriction enzyme S subunit